MEAALRTAYEIVVGQEVPFPKLNIYPVRGMEGVKEAAIPIPKTAKGFEFLNGATLKVAVAHGTINAAYYGNTRTRFIFYTTNSANTTGGW